LPLKLPKQVPLMMPIALSSAPAGCPMSRFWDMGSRRAAALYLALLLSPLLLNPPLYAQGCAQCRDNTAATPPSTQAAYRHAIIIMVCVAGGIFLTTLIILKRQH
jgi:hypothetical protein